MRYWLIAPLLFAAAPAMAATVFDNGVSNHDGTSIAGGRRLAEDFTLAGNTSITGGSLFQLGYGVGSLNYFIYSSTGSQPDGLLASGTATSTRTSLGVFNFFTEYRTDFTFETPFIALAGTEYWIAFGYSGGSTTSVYWASTAPRASDNGRLASGGSWVDPHGLDYAFSLTGSPATIAPPVPEPATWAMLIAGFGAVGHVLRRRRTGSRMPQAV